MGDKNNYADAEIAIPPQIVAFNIWSTLYFPLFKIAENQKEIIVEDQIAKKLFMMDKNRELQN